MKLNLHKLFLPNSFPWELTPWDRPSNYVPLFSSLCRIGVWLSDSHTEKSFLNGNPSLFELSSKDIPEWKVTYSICVFMERDWRGYNNDEVVLKFLYDFEKFTNFLEKELFKAIGNGKLILPASYFIVEK